MRCCSCGCALGVASEGVAAQAALQLLGKAFRLDRVCESLEVKGQCFAAVFSPCSLAVAGLPAREAAPARTCLSYMCIQAMICAVDSKLLRLLLRVCDVILQTQPVGASPGGTCDAWLTM